MNPASLHTPACIWNVGADLGEGALWHAPTRSVYFVDIKGRRIHRCAEDGSRRTSWEAPGQPGFVVPYAKGGLVCALEDGLYRVDETSGEFSTLLKVEDALPGNRFNDGHVDAGGNLWFGSMDDAQAAATGALYRLGRDGSLTRADHGYLITNGPAISPDGRTLAYITRTGGAFRLSVMDLGTGQSQQISESNDDESPAFAPNGRLIVYATRAGGKEVLMTTTLDGKIKTPLLVTLVEVREPTWGPFTR